MKFENSFSNKLCPLPAKPLKRALAGTLALGLFMDVTWLCKIRDEFLSTAMSRYKTRHPMDLIFSDMYFSDAVTKQQCSELENIKNQITTNLKSRQNGEEEVKLFVIAVENTIRMHTYIINLFIGVFAVYVYFVPHFIKQIQEYDKWAQYLIYGSNLIGVFVIFALIWQKRRKFTELESFLSLLKNFGNHAKP